MFTMKQALDLAQARVLSIQGRSSPSEYWWVYLAVFVTATALSLIALTLLAISPSVVGIAAELISNIFTICVAFIMLIIGIRRLHDRDMSGWWFLLALIPIVGSLILLVILILPGKPGVNRFGINPVEDPQGHYNYYCSKQYKTYGAYGAQFGFAQGGFNQGGFNQNGFNQSGFNQGGFNPNGFNQGGFNQGTDAFGNQAPFGQQPQFYQQPQAQQPMPPTPSQLTQQPYQGQPQQPNQNQQ